MSRRASNHHGGAVFRRSVTLETAVDHVLIHPPSLYFCVVLRATGMALTVPPHY